IPGAGRPDARIVGGATTHDEIDIEAIHAAVASLPARQREVIEALKFRDQSVREVAGRLSMTESAVKVTAPRGYRALKRPLGGHEGGAGAAHRATGARGRSCPAACATVSASGSMDGGGRADDSTWRHRR